MPLPWKLDELVKGRAFDDNIYIRLKQVSRQKQKQTLQLKHAKAQVPANRKQRCPIRQEHKEMQRPPSLKKKEEKKEKRKEKSKIKLRKKTEEKKKFFLTFFF